MEHHMADKAQTLLAELRRRAESSLNRLVKQPLPNRTQENTEALLHELQVHEVELKLQYQELQRAQAETEESRDRYRELYESIPIGYVTIDVTGRMYDKNPTSARLLGIDQQQSRLNNDFFFFFFCNDEVNTVILFCRDLLARQRPGTCEFKMKKADNTPLIAALEAVPVTIGEGKGERLRIAFQDITCRKEAEERLRRQQTELETNRADLQELTRKLFTAQEEERKRIAWELHDDHCQRVTALVMETKMLAKTCERQLPELVPRLSSVSKKLTALLHDFRTLSHELLPRNLEDVSLVGPIRDLLGEFSGKAGFEIEFFEREVPVNIPPVVMTTVFRLLQETLSNITKHASAQHVSVTLGGTDHDLALVVTDDGIGFDPTRPSNVQKGLGIVGMRERLRPLGGTVTINSRSGQGTTITFSVPTSIAVT